MKENLNMFKFKYIGIIKRALAGIIDLIIFFPVVPIFIRVTKFSVENKIVWPMFVYYILIYLVYMFLIVKYGGTPGKLLLNIRIVNIYGNNISYIQALLRFLPYMSMNVIYILKKVEIFQSSGLETLSLVDIGLQCFSVLDGLTILFSK